MKIRPVDCSLFPSLNFLLKSIEQLMCISRWMPQRKRQNYRLRIWIMACALSFSKQMIITYRSWCGFNKLMTNRFSPHFFPFFDHLSIRLSAIIHSNGMVWYDKRIHSTEQETKMRTVVDVCDSWFEHKHASFKSNAFRRSQEAKWRSNTNENRLKNNSSVIKVPNQKKQ